MGHPGARDEQERQHALGPGLVEERRLAGRLPQELVHPLEAVLRGGRPVPGLQPERHGQPELAGGGGGFAPQAPLPGLDRAHRQVGPDLHVLLPLGEPGLGLDGAHEPGGLPTRRPARRRGTAPPPVGPRPRRGASRTPRPPPGAARSPGRSRSAPAAGSRSAAAPSSAEAHPAPRSTASQPMPGGADHFAAAAYALRAAARGAVSSGTNPWSRMASSAAAPSGRSPSCRSALLERLPAIGREALPTVTTHAGGQRRGPGHHLELGGEGERGQGRRLRAVEEDRDVLAGDRLAERREHLARLHDLDGRGHPPPAGQSAVPVTKAGA